jgi:hypothetical protein
VLASAEGGLGPQPRSNHEKTHGARSSSCAAGGRSGARDALAPSALTVRRC